MLYCLLFKHKSRVRSICLQLIKVMFFLFWRIFSGKAREQSVTWHTPRDIHLTSNQDLWHIYRLISHYITQTVRYQELFQATKTTYSHRISINRQCYSSCHRDKLFLKIKKKIKLLCTHCVLSGMKNESKSFPVFTNAADSIIHGGGDSDGTFGARNYIQPPPPPTTFLPQQRQLRE